MATQGPLVVAIVGADGCGKSSTYRGLLWQLASRMPVCGIGEELLCGEPGVALRVAPQSLLSRATRAAGRRARGTPRPRVYQLLKLLELAGRARLRDRTVARSDAYVVVTDGDPLVNSAAWSAAAYYREELAGDDARLLELIANLAGEARLPIRELRHLPRRTWQLAVSERLGLVRFRPPDLVVHLAIDGTTAMQRVRTRHRPLQAHESAAFLGRLDAGYARVCSLLEENHAVPILRIDVARVALPEVVAIVETAVLEHLAQRPTSQAGARSADGADAVGADVIDVIATTISGSLADQRKVGRIGPEFLARTRRPVRVHAVDSHLEARARTHDVVTAGGRTVVSAGGAGTFNAVLEGSHLDDGPPPDLRLAFLRKGSADLIGKSLGVPDDLASAVDAIAGGIEADATLAADVLAVEGMSPDGAPQLRHIVGFGGLGLFGDVPRFTESRMVKLYKGILGTLFGDYGPFYTGLSLASLRWFALRGLRRSWAQTLVLDSEELPPETWLAVIVANGDLGPDFPLGRGLDFASGSFRVVGLRFRGLRTAVDQLRACRTASVLDDPDRHAAVVREVRSFVARPAAPAGPASGPTPVAMVNVDGLRMLVRGEVRFSISGKVRLVIGVPHGGAPASVSPSGAATDDDRTPGRSRSSGTA